MQICHSILYLQNMDYIQRYLTNTIRKAMVSFPAVLVTGARQTGKTTLLRTEFGASHDYVSLERPDIRNRALAGPVGFFARTLGPLILDEIQCALREATNSAHSPSRRTALIFLTLASP